MHKDSLRKSGRVDEHAARPAARALTALSVPSVAAQAVGGHVNEFASEKSGDSPLSIDSEPASSLRNNYME